MGGKPITSLLNKGTRKTFVAILKDNKRVVDIAHVLKLKRITIYDQLKRLEEEKLVKRLPKRKGFIINYKQFRKSREIAEKFYDSQIREIRKSREIAEKFYDSQIREILNLRNNFLGEIEVNRDRYYRNKLSRNTRGIIQ